MLMLTEFYLRVYQSFWITTLVKLDTQDYPALLIKADNSTTFLKEHPFKIGLSFIKGKTGNLFGLFVEFEGPYPYNCPTKPLVFFEDISGLDHEENRNRLLSNFDTERLHIWLAEGGDASVSEGVMRADPIDVKYETLLNIQPACREKLNEVARRHFDQHLRIGPDRWDYEATGQEFSAQMPLDASPILPRQVAGQQTQIVHSPVDRGGERQGDHVVIFVRGDPDWDVVPESVKSVAMKAAEESGIVWTTGTKVHSFRNSDESVTNASKGQSVALLAVSELAIRLGKRILDDYLAKKLFVKEVYCPRSGWLFKRTPDCAVVMISDKIESQSSTTPKADDVPQDAVEADTHLVIVHGCDAKVRSDVRKVGTAMNCPRCEERLFPGYFTKLLARLKSDEHFAATTRERKGNNLKSWEFLITDGEVSCALDYVQWLHRRRQQEASE